MRSRFGPALVVAMAVFPGVGSAAPDFESINHAVVNEVVVPAYETMALEMTALHQTTMQFCEAPNPTRFTALRNTFGRAMDAWQSAQPFVFGPIMKDGRHTRVQFWPDRNGVGSRQLRRVLKQRPANLVAPGGLQGRSVALQNISTFERLAFIAGPELAAGKSDPRNTYACALMASIAGFQSDLAKAILDEWVTDNGYRDTVATAKPGNAVYPESKSATTAIYKSFVSTLDAIIRFKLERPMSKTIENARPKRAESWRSRRSLDNLIANLQSLQALYTVKNGFGDALAKEGAAALDTGLRRLLTETIKAARMIDVPLSVAIENPDSREKLSGLLDQVKTLRDLFGGPVASALGITVGFNAHDGD